MSKHTPGPWNIEKHSMSWCISKPSRTTTVVPIETTIANVQGNNEVAQANACLIAAAPEMYEALKDIENDESIPSKFWDKIQNAIAKAEGRSDE